VADYPTVIMDVAEIDPEVVVAARRYFGVQEGDRLQVSARDGRLHLRSTQEARDIILTDAYLKDKIPFHLATRDFFVLARDRLKAGGVIAVNLIGALDGPDSRLFRAIYKTVREVFSTVYVFPVDLARNGSLDQVRNIVLLATEAPVLSGNDITRRAQALVDGGVVTVDRFVEATRDLYGERIPTDDVPVLSDDFAPVDALIPSR
jgi:spermidine synthase